MALTRRVLGRAAMGVCVAGFGGCRLDGSNVLGVIPKGRSHFFWTNIHAGAAPACKENGLELIWHGPQKENDTAAQQEIAERLLLGRCKAIAVAPIDEKILDPILRVALERDKWVFVFDSISTVHGICGSIATDNRAAGELAAKEVALRTNNKGTVAILRGTDRSQSTRERESGFREYLKKNVPDLRIVAEKSGEAEIRTGLVAAKELLESKPTALFTSNESGTVAALHAQKFQGQKNNHKLIHVGFDWTPDLLEAVRDGNISALIVQDPHEIGKRLVSVVAKYRNGQSAGKPETLPPQVVTIDTLNTDVIKKILTPEQAAT